MNYEEIINQIFEIVDEVGAYQLEAKKDQNFSVETKGSNVDFVTDIDKTSEEMIVKRIKAFHPDHSILAEETGMADMDSDYKWVIDPIDGTTNFVHNHPFHCISIGLKYKGETVLGVVDIPTIKMRFSTIKGQGAYLNGEPIKVTDKKTLDRSIIATGFPYSRKEDNMNIPYFLEIVNEVAGIRRGGSAAVDLCFVAAGMLDGYWEFTLNEWDICAGVLLIEEAGGVVTDTIKDGHSLIICGGKTIHDILTSYVLEA